MANSARHEPSAKLSSVWWLNNPEDYREGAVPYLLAMEPFALREKGFSGAGDQQDREPEDREVIHQTEMAEMHERLAEAIDLKIDWLLHSEYLPQWMAGQGSSTQGVDAANLPAGDTRDAKLRATLRVKLYQDLEKKLRDYLTRVDQSGLNQRTLPDEKTFIELLLEALVVWIMKLGKDAHSETENTEVEP